MGGHDAAERRPQPAVRRGVVGQNGFEAALVHGHGQMRIGLDKAVARKMFAAAAHAALQQAMGQALGQQADHARVTRKSAVANHAAGAVVQVQHRRKAEVHAAGPQLRAQHIAAGARRAHRIQRTGLAPCLGCGQPHVAQGAHGRHVGKTIGFEALHAPAFVVHTNQQIWAQAFDAFAQGAELRAAFPVAAKQNQAAHQRVAQAFAVYRRQALACNINDQRRVKTHKGRRCECKKCSRPIASYGASTMQKLTA